MKTERMDVNAALERGLVLPFALVRSLSRVALGPTPESVDRLELLEARFFDGREEIRIFRDEAGLQAVRLRSEAGDAALEQDLGLMNPMFGKTLRVRRVLEFDEDGQAYIAQTMLTGWEGGDA